jgi:hypothetical protein
VNRRISAEQDSTQKHENIKIALDLGANYSNITPDRPKLDRTNPTGVPGYKIGLLTSISINKYMELKSGLYLMKNGYKNDTGGIATSMTMKTLEVPLQLVAKFKGFYIGAGPYAALHIKNARTHTYGGITDHFPIKMNFDNTWYCKSWDAGVGATAGYCLNNGLFVKIYYQNGLTIQYIDDDIMTKRWYSSSCGVSVGYYFWKRRGA